MNSFHDKSEIISQMVCNLCRKNLLPHSCVRPTEKQIDLTYNYLYQMGARRGIFRSKLNYLIMTFLHNAGNYKVFAEHNIELMCRYSNGNVAFWNGKGAKKDFNFDRIANAHELTQQMGGFSPPSGFVWFRIDITSIWSDISPYLET